MKLQEKVDIASTLGLILLLLFCWFLWGCASTPPPYNSSISESNLVQELYFDLKADGVIDYEWGATPQPEIDRLEAKAKMLLQNTDGQ
jgi:hypothetical protein